MQFSVVYFHACSSREIQAKSNEQGMAHVVCECVPSCMSTNVEHTHTQAYTRVCAHESMPFTLHMHATAGVRM